MSIACFVTFSLMTAGVADVRADVVVRCAGDEQCAHCVELVTQFGTGVAVHFVVLVTVDELLICDAPVPLAVVSVVDLE